MYLIFDTETTGLPLNYKAPASNTDNWPRMVQIAWQLYDKNGELISEYEQIVKPEGYTIPKKVSEIHRITTERAIAEGIALNQVLDDFKKAMMQAEYLIAHNLGFDEKIVAAEFFRKKIKALSKKMKRFDTMHEATEYCAIPGRYGRYKWPNLTELHKKLFHFEFEEAHDALVDVRACAKCFFELKKQGIFKI